MDGSSGRIAESDWVGREGKWLCVSMKRGQAGMGAIQVVFLHHFLQLLLCLSVSMGLATPTPPLAVWRSTTMDRAGALSATTSGL